MLKRPTLTTRKPNVEITRLDLETYPIWEYVTDEETKPGLDETWIRPVKGRVIRPKVYSQIVAADFTSAGHTRLFGFMMVTTAIVDASIEAGALVGDFGYAVLPTLSVKQAREKAYHWQTKERRRVLSVLRGVRVFPLRYCLRANISGEKDPRMGFVR